MPITGGVVPPDDRVPNRTRDAIKRLRPDVIDVISGHVEMLMARQWRRGLVLGMGLGAFIGSLLTSAIWAVLR